MVIQAFNLTYFLMLAVLVVTAVVLTVLLKNKSKETKSWVIFGICLFNVAFYVVYKFGLYFGTPGLPESYSFDPWLELPFHLCNISLILVPLGILLKKDFLMAYGVYVAPLGAVMALTFPAEGFGGLNIFYFHMLGYYGTHAIIVLVGILLVSMDLYRPTFRKVPVLFLFVVALSLCAFGVSLLIRSFTDSAANYFYTVGPEGISILEAFWSWIPVSYLYYLPAVGIFAVYASLLTLPFWLYDRKKAKSLSLVK